MKGAGRKWKTERLDELKETFEKLIKEEKELGEKIVSLNESLFSDRFNEKVGNYQFELLNLQHGAMITYRRILIMRINNLKIKDEESICECGSQKDQDCKYCTSCNSFNSI